MSLFLKKWIKKNNIKYLLYALGEILLIIVGILIAVGINERQATNKNNIVRCQYLQELKFALDQDKVDVQLNLDAFNEWNPQLREIYFAIAEKKLAHVDSLNYKMNSLWSYVTFLQQSKGKIEELKFSNINLVTNRILKNRILMYQETKITFLLEHQRRFNQVNDKVEEYILKNDMKLTAELEKNEYLFRLIGFKYTKHETMLEHYNILLKELIEINELIEIELTEKCPEYKKDEEI